MIPEEHELPSPPPSNWGPYRNAGDFSACMAIILASLLAALVLALSISTLIRRLLRRLRQQHATGDPEKPASSMVRTLLADSLPTVVFSSGTALPGCAASTTDCAICLLEFLDGDAVRLLPDCGHGFHVGCVDRWIASRRSCPTCRKTCFTATAPAPDACGP